MTTTTTTTQPVLAVTGIRKSFFGVEVLSGIDFDVRPGEVLGLVGLGLAVVGTILACIPFVGFFGWLLLPAGFVVSIVSLFLKGKKWPGITGLVVSVVGAIIAVVVSFFLFFVFASQVGEQSTFPPSDTDGGTSEESDPGTDDGFGSPDVMEGTLGDPVVVTQLSGTAEVTLTSAAWSTTNGSSFEAENGGYLLIDLTWEALDGTTNVNPLYFAVETAEGGEGVYDIFADATLDAREVTAGQTVQGSVSFDVAQSSSYVVVITDELMQEVARVTVEPSAG